MARATLSDLESRYLDLVGDSGGTIDTFGTRNINYAIKDILNKYAWSWALRTTTLTLSSGAANFPADFNPIWGLKDARIVGTSTSDDHVFTIVPIPARDQYTSDDYVAWVTYDAANDVYVFNTNTQTGTVTIFYYTSYVGIDTTGTTWRTELSVSTDKTIIPDAEAVSTLAASKHWIGAERDNELKQVYAQDAERLITAMWIRDCNTEGFVSEGALSDQLNQTTEGMVLNPDGTVTLY